jgi:hypothetical protein
MSISSWILHRVRDFHLPHHNKDLYDRCLCSEPESQNCCHQDLPIASAIDDVESDTDTVGSDFFDRRFAYGCLSERAALSHWCGGSEHLQTSIDTTIPPGRISRCIRQEELLRNVPLSIYYREYSNSGFGFELNCLRTFLSSTEVTRQYQNAK